MSAVRDPVVLLRLALREGDRELAIALVRSFRQDRRLSRRADAELRGLTRGPLAPGARRT
jgi:hypothetical protein